MRNKNYKTINNECQNIQGFHYKNSFTICFELLDILFGGYIYNHFNS